MSYRDHVLIYNSLFCLSSRDREHANGACKTLTKVFLKSVLACSTLSNILDQNLIFDSIVVIENCLTRKNNHHSRGLQVSCNTVDGEFWKVKLSVQKICIRLNN